MAVIPGMRTCRSCGHEAVLHLGLLLAGRWLNTVVLLQGLLVSDELANQVHEEGNKAYRVKKTGLDR